MFTSCQTPVAIRKPTPSPDWSSATPRPRVRSDQISDTSALPGPHSAPMPRPVRKRKMMNTAKLPDNAVRPAKTAYQTIASISVRRRPT